MTMPNSVGSLTLYKTIVKGDLLFLWNLIISVMSKSIIPSPLMITIVSSISPAAFLTPPAVPRGVSSTE